MSGHEPLQAFLDKWLARWPEWRIAETFIPHDRRETALAWFALLQEWMDAAIGGDEPAPGLAKLAWWQEELRGWAKGARRHPLGQALQAQGVDWAGIADAMPVLAERAVLRGEPVDHGAPDSGPMAGDRPEPADGGIARNSAVERLQTLATRLAVAEGVLLGMAPDWTGLARDWLVGSGAAHVAARPDAATDSAASVPRRLLRAMLDARGRALPRWRLPWRFWRAARRAASWLIR